MIIKPGLLLKDSPEPRHELYCDNYGSKTKPCNILFDTTEEFEQHKFEVHQKIIGVWRKSNWLNGERHWYPVEHEKDYADDFIRIHFRLPLRPKRRFNVTREMLDNINSHPTKCWCGKPKSEWKTKRFQRYCSKEHSHEWWDRVDYVNWHRDKFLHKNRKCSTCGFSGPTSYQKRYEMDHVIAIVLGGHPWHEDNLQTLCTNCHKIKTASDVKILAWWKRQAKYDIGPIIPDPQIKLEVFV